MVSTSLASPWPAGSGEMARLIREHDWAATPLGYIAGWPERTRGLIDLMMASSEIMFLAAGPDLTMIYNDAFGSFLAAKHPGALGTPFRSVFAEIWDDLRPLVEVTLVGQQQVMVDQHFLTPWRPEALEGWFTATWTPVRDAAGAVSGFLASIRETTAKVGIEAATRASEERQAFFLKLSDTLRALVDPVAIQGEAARLLREHLDSGWCYYVEWDETGTIGHVLRDNTREGLPSMVGVHDVSDAPEFTGLLKSGKLLNVPDFASYPRFPPRVVARYTGIGIHSTLGPSLVKNGQLIATLSLADTAPREWSEDDIALVGEVAERTWGAVERARSDEALRESEERFRAIVETATDYAIFTTDPEGRIETWPRGAQEVYGWSAEEAVGQSVDITFTPEDRAKDEPERERREARENGLALNVRWHLRKDGSRVFIDGISRPLHGSDGKLTGFVKVGQDVTERRATEERLRESEARQAFLLGLSDALRPLSDPVEIQAEAARLLGEHLGSDRAYYVEVNEARGEFVVARDWHRLGASSHAGRYPLEAWSMPWLASGETWVMRDVATDPVLPDEQRDAYRRQEIGSLIVVPLLKEGRLLGTWLTNQRAPRNWTAAEVQLVEEVAARTWDAIERARAETALRESEARLAMVLEQVPVGVGLFDAQGRYTLKNHRSSEILRGDSIPSRNPAEGSHWQAFDLTGQPVSPEDYPGARALRGEVVEAPVDFLHTADGSEHWLRVSAVPLRGEDGAVSGGIVVAQDVTEELKVQRALRESEARFRQFGEASADVLWIRDCETLAFEYVSPAFEELYGTRLDDVLSGNHLRRWLEMIVPEDREKVMDVVRWVRGGEQVQHDFRILRSDGQVRWIRNTDFPLRDEAGHVQRIGGIAHDATEEVELQDRLRVLVAELQHRSRNLVGVVKGVTERTLATSDTLDGFRARFRPRLEALGRVNALLSRLEEGDRVTFDQLLRTELAAKGVLDGDAPGPQVQLSGPRGIRLRSATVQTFALALHELATNALKYGALSRPEGRLAVTWSLLPDPKGERRLRVEWRESGVSPAQHDGMPATSQVNGTPVPRRQGYGRELIERALPYQLKAQTSYEITPEGVRCTIVVPVSSTLDLAFSSQGGTDA